MKLQITKSEFNNLITYLKEEKNNPCTACSTFERSVCCGCPKQKEYAKKLKTIQPTATILNSEPITKFGKSMIEVQELENKIQSLIEQRLKLTEDANLILVDNDIEIIED